MFQGLFFLQKGCSENTRLNIRKSFQPSLASSTKSKTARHEKNKRIAIDERFTLNNPILHLFLQSLYSVLLVF